MVSVANSQPELLTSATDTSGHASAPAANTTVVNEFASDANFGVVAPPSKDLPLLAGCLPFNPAVSHCTVGRMSHE